MILESVVTTVSVEGELNIAPMGPDFDPFADHFELRPFDNSQTCRNLYATSSGVLHITDNVLLIASSAINRLEETWQSEAAEKVDGRILSDCCRWYEFKCTEKPSNSSRKAFHCQIVSSGRRHDFFGFNRAKHAVLEATIAVSRINFLPREHITELLDRAGEMVERTGGQDEKAACELLGHFVEEQFESKE